MFRDPADDRYRLTILVRALRHGFDDDGWVTQIAKPCLAELGRDLVWPVSIATLSGTMMVLRETTDHATPLATVRYTAGHRLPLLSTATGRVYLAFCTAAERDGLLDSLARSTREEDKLARSPLADTHRMLADVAQQGFAATTHDAPVDGGGLPRRSRAGARRRIGDPTVRFNATAVPMPAAIERFLPKLHHSAAKMVGLLSEQSSVGVASTP